ncbi:MAG: flippase [Desulfurella sp.]
MLNKFPHLTSHFSRITSHSGFRRYTANTAWLFTEQLVRMLVGFFVGVWVARYLGPENYGILSYSLAFVALFQGIAKLGLDGIVVRELVKFPEKRDELLGTSFWLKFIGSVITFLIVVVVAYITADKFETFVYISIIAAGLIFQSFEVIDFYYQATVQAKYITVRRIIQLIISSSLKIYFILIKADLIWFVLVSLFDAVSLAVFSWWIYRMQNLPAFFRYFDKQLAKMLLKDSWTLIFASFFTLFVMNINRIILKNMYGFENVGFYSVAESLTGIWIFITTIITTSLAPSITNAKKVNEFLYKQRILNLFRLLLLVSISISLIIFMLSDFLVSKLYGDKYLSTIPILRIYVWSNIFVFLGNASWQWYINENKQNTVLTRLFLGAISSLFFGLLLIKYYGAVGAALNTIISYSISFYFGNLLSRQTIPLFFIQSKALISMFNLRIKEILKGG